MENKEELKESGVDALRKIGAKEISNRTFIHEEELKRFLSGDFADINKTKAMGFIQILQREYNIDLSDLKQKYLEYSNEHFKETKIPQQSIMMEEVQSEERKKGIFSFILLVGTIGAMYYVINKYDLLNFTSPSSIKTATVSQDKNDNKIQLNLNNLTQQKEETKAPEQQVSLNEVLTPTKETDEVKKEQTQATQPEQEKEEKQETTPSNDANDLDLSKLNNDLAQNDTADTTQNPEATNSEEQNNTSSTEAVTDELYITPTSKVWIGTIDMDTLKKKDFLAPRGDRVDIDTSKNELIMIGHRFVKMYLNGNLVKFKRKGPIRFKYVDGNLTEINRREFNKLAKGRQW